MIIRKNPNIRFPNPDPSRVPPGQFVTREWPVLHAGSVPAVDLATSRLPSPFVVMRSSPKR
ncbi:MAG: hypothetical protein WEB59_00205 [Thermoanaerobaculia bacterium]